MDTVDREKAQEAKVKAASESLKEELVKKKVEESMNGASDKRTQEQLKRVQAQLSEKQAELDKAGKTLMIAKTANDAEQKAVSSAESDVRKADAEGKVQGDQMQRRVADKEQEE